MIHSAIVKIKLKKYPTNTTNVYFFKTTENSCDLNF